MLLTTIKNAFPNGNINLGDFKGGAVGYYNTYLPLSRMDHFRTSKIRYAASSINCDPGRSYHT
jgi:hypothetical protein